MERLIVDRIEEGIAVCEAEDMSHRNIPVMQLPEGTREGSAVISDNGLYTLDEAYSEQRRSEILKKQSSIFKKS